jgi:2-dehydropantoate 2-reductase
MRIVLFGTGALACLFGARFARCADVTLVDSWMEGIAAVRERGILLEDAGERQSIPVRAQSLGDPAVAADLVLVLVKAWQTKSIASQLAQYLSSRGLAVSLQNGIGNVELLGTRTFPGSTSEGATLLGPGHVRAGGAGTTRMVAPDWAVNLFREAGFDSYSCSALEAESLLWGKLCVNCGINALTGLLRVENGKLLESRDATELMVRATEECAAVARAKGIPLPFDNPAAQVKDVARRTAGNRSSMYQDILRGAPTECDAIYGAVVREAALHGVEVPVNRVLWKLVRALTGSDRRDFQ